MALPYEFGSPEFDEAIRKATHEAFLETLRAGLPVTYLDDDGLNVLEFPDGRRFEIRWSNSTLPSGKNYEIIRQLDTRAA
jgi:hypothetical protein